MKSQEAEAADGDPSEAAAAAAAAAAAVVTAVTTPDVGSWRLRRVNCAFVVALAALCSFMAACPYVDGNVFGYKDSGRRETGDEHYRLDAQTFLHFLTTGREAMCGETLGGVGGGGGQLLVPGSPQSAYCREASLSDHFVHIGLANGYKICQSMFRNERWNCTFAAPFLNSGYPQAAFVWAITVSKAIEELVMACRRGVPGLDCPCHQTPRQRSGRQQQQQQQRRQNRRQNRRPNRRDREENRRQERPRRSIALGKEQLKMLNPEKISEKYGNLNVPTCDDNIALASQRVRQFFRDSRGFAPDMAFIDMVNFHNRRAGHIVVKRSRISICNCLGISGSCSKRICIKGLRRHSRRIESNLQKLFIRSKHVLPPASLQQLLPPSSATSPTELDLRRVNRRQASQLFYHDERQRRAKRVRKKLLVYTNRPPDFCQRNEVAGYFGVDERQCNVTVPSTDHRSCVHLCCGSRNHHVEYHYKTDWCNCAMRYNPIKVVCQRCEQQIEQHRCRIRRVFT